MRHLFYVPNHFALRRGSRTASPKWPTVPMVNGTFMLVRLAEQVSDCQGTSAKGRGAPHVDEGTNKASRAVYLSHNEQLNELIGRLRQIMLDLHGTMEDAKDVDVTIGFDQIGNG